ncbi:MAG: DUF3320 domain-containing protein [Kiritimatiellia bacterium]
MADAQTQSQTPISGVDVLEYVNLALVQNGLPAIQNLRINNTTDDPLRDVVCAFASDEELVIPGEVAFKEIPPHGTAGKANVGILLNARRIAEVSGDPITGHVSMIVSSSGRELFRQDFPMTVLAVDQWLGIRPYAELLSAYAQPNADFVNRLQAEAAHEIELSTGASSLEGYQGDKKRVLEICAAIYSAIQKTGIRYCNPPSSFGVPGQKIRLADTVEKFKLGTCIETSLLMASVMEKCELHPVLILVKGHCYVGCHLIEEMFEDVVTWNLQALRKRADLDEFVAIETTKVTTDTPFNEAERCGREHLSDDESFTCAIDVVRSRESGIRPITCGVGGGSAAYMAAGRQVDAEGNGLVRNLKESIDLSALPEAQGTQGRIDRWTQKLLDFSARNRLLNIPKSSRQIIPLVCANVSGLEDQIAANETITIRSIAESMGEKALDDLLNNRLTREQCSNIVDAELTHHRLCVMMPQSEVRKRLSDLLHDAKTELEESGVNTLFLSIGTLQWVEPGTGSNRKSYRAPILLVPVRLARASMAEGVKLFRLDEDTTINATLIEFLRAQFNLTLPGLDPLPTDDSGVDVALILQIFRQAVKEMEGWEVRDDAYIGCFSFGKFVMWKDMTERVDDLKASPLVNHLIGGGGCFDDGINVFPADEVAQHFNPGELFCPVSYDSSQLAAVLYSEMGKSFVLHGPPGTGKSQTITNIIAHNLALGRRVLFVSEKKAALEVVKDRLDRIGLTPFCLELHSNKTEKGRFYAQIKEALNVPETPAPGEWNQVVADFEKCRSELNGYIKDLHASYPNGLTAYDCFTRIIQSDRNSQPELVSVNCLEQSRDAYRDSRQSVLDLSSHLRSASEIALKVTPELRTTTWSPVFERQLKTATEKVAIAAENALEALRQAYCKIGLVEDYNADAVNAALDVIRRLRSASRMPSRFQPQCGLAEPAVFQKLASLVDAHAKLAGELSRYRIEKLREVDVDSVESRLVANAQSFFVFRFFKDRALVAELSSIVKLGGGKLTAAGLAADLPKIRELLTIESQYAEQAGGSIDDTIEIAADIRDDFEQAISRDKELKELVSALDEFVDVALLPANLPELVSTCRSFVENIADLRNVIRCRSALARVRELGMGVFADYLMANDDGCLDVGGLFDASYASKMLEMILSQDKILSEFTGLTQEERIERFRELDRKYTTLAKRVVFARLAATLPRRRSGPCPEGSELGMLKRECEKKTRQKAVRQMLAESRTLIPMLKPCFLMSPLSVAQYLPVDTAPFDLIVFDEASQIPVWDAIGVIARGKQLIVVGDPKQMPPTSFFQKGDIEDADADDESISDQESILDECLVAGVYSTYLNWHYRSRHEALIAFSNEHYYSNKLYTFPAACNSARLGVKFEFVKNGVFARNGRGSRVNTVEAEALVDYICAEVRKADYKQRSIGIVTFSQPQQKLIRTLLEERRSADPILEKRLPEEGEGAYFVKNLENVQGDESDVILFSVGYAPDENGKFTMNFGPLNLAGGERRLNVAVTRAREQVIVFASIHGRDIDAGEGGRTRAVGAGHLKAFLEYAERGSAGPGESAVKRAADDFGSVVAHFLESNGYEVERDVGCSEYRIDVAVKAPENPCEYLMGIECDGRSYAEQFTAQDRDVNRTAVLNGLGWHMCRVWSVDWAYDRKRAESHLLELIQQAREEPALEKAAESAPDGGESHMAAENAPMPADAVRPRHKQYVVWQSPSIYLHDYFYEASSRQRISQMVGEVVKQEWPIYETVVRRRVSKAWGLSRMTEGVQRVFDTCVPADVVVTEHETGKVYWPKEAAVAEYHDYRVPSQDPNSKRSIEEIPPEELMNAMVEILTDLGGCHQDELYRETIRLFGWQTLTAKARRYLEIAFSLLKESGIV